MYLTFLYLFFLESFEKILENYHKPYYREVVRSHLQFLSYAGSANLGTLGGTAAGVGGYEYNVHKEKKRQGAGPIVAVVKVGSPLEYPKEPTQIGRASCRERV